MAYMIGTKGQVVIAKEIRDQLGVEPGWIALQRLAGDHIEVYFFPPEHRKSLKGSLAVHVKVRVGTGREWEKAREIAWRKAAKKKKWRRGAAHLSCPTYSLSGRWRRRQQRKNVRLSLLLVRTPEEKPGIELKSKTIC